MTPYGLLVLHTNQVFLFLTRSKVTSDFIVDRVEQWWRTHRRRLRRIHTLVLLLDNGPENESRRTQFLGRIVEFAEASHVRVVLGYYPPYHSKYNPIERVWGVLEKHWGAALLDCDEAVFGYSQSMTWRGVHPIVEWVEQLYPSGVRLNRAQMKRVEARVHRLEGLEDWFVDIPPPGGTKYFAG